MRPVRPLQASIGQAHQKVKHPKEGRITKAFHGTRAFRDEAMRIKAGKIGKEGPIRLSHRYTLRGRSHQPEGRLAGDPIPVVRLPYNGPALLRQARRREYLLTERYRGLHSRVLVEHLRAGHHQACA